MRFESIQNHLNFPCELKDCYFQYIDTQQTLGDFNKTVEDELQDYQALQNLTGWKLKQAKIWMVLDYPRSSRLALVSKHNFGTQYVMFCSGSISKINK